jgi:hypothetical protein
MAVTITDTTQKSDTLWLFTFSSDLGGTPTFYIYIDGVLNETTTATTKLVQIQYDREFQIEILDDVNAVPAEAYPDFARISWEPVANAAKYRIDQWDGVSAWDELAVILDTNQNTFVYDTQKIDDVTDYTFRIVPLNSADIEGSPREFNLFMVRRPDRPNVTYTYDNGTAKITATVAA